MVLQGGMWSYLGVSIKSGKLDFSCQSNLPDFCSYIAVSIYVL